MFQNPNSQTFRDVNLRVLWTRCFVHESCLGPWNQLPHRGEKMACQLRWPFRDEKNKPSMAILPCFFFSKPQLGIFGVSKSHSKLMHIPPWIPHVRRWLRILTRFGLDGFFCEQSMANTVKIIDFSNVARQPFLNNIYHFLHLLDASV